MANHVQNSITVSTNEAGQAVWNKLIAILDEAKDPNAGWGMEVSLHNLFEERPNDDELTRDWMCDNVGAKWAYAQDWDESFLNVQSAWSPVAQFAEYVSAQISAVDPDAILTMTYEDEFYNFVGVARFEHGEEVFDSHIEYDELLERLRNNVSELAELWDEDEEDWTDEDAAQDLISEYIHDEVWMWQEKHS